MPKTIIITSASSGFGAMTAQALASAGHTVCAGMRDLAGHNAQAAAHLEQYASTHGANLLAIEMDVTGQASVDAVIGQVTGDTGRLDVILHNAGHMVLGAAEAFTVEQLVVAYDVNLLSTSESTEPPLPHLQAQRARAGQPPFTDPSLRSRLAGISLPTLVVCGDNDGIADPGYGRAYAGAIPGARFQLLPGTGHLPQIEPPGRSSRRSGTSPTPTRRAGPANLPTANPGQNAPFPSGQPRTQGRRKHHVFLAAQHPPRLATDGPAHRGHDGGPPLHPPRGRGPGVRKPAAARAPVKGLLASAVTPPRPRRVLGDHQPERNESHYPTIVYSATKAAVSMLTAEYAKAADIKSNAVKPGFTATDLTGNGAGQMVVEGAELIVRLATIGQDGPTGIFRETAGELAW